MRRPIIIFFTTLCLVFIIQQHYFKLFILGDNYLWVQRVQNMSGDLFRLPPHLDFTDANGDYRYGAHPGTSILLPAALAHKLGADPQTSLTTTTVLLNSILIAGIALTCFQLRPHSPWWLLATLILTLHPLYFYGTPINAVIAPATALLFLLSLAIYENRRQANLWLYVIAFAGVSGLSLATRLPITVVISLPLLVFIAAYVKLSQTLLAIFITGLTAFLLNPFLWLLPLEFLATIILRTASHVVYTGNPGLNYTPTHFLNYTPITFIGLLFIIAFLSLPPRKPPVPRQWLLTLIFITTSVTIILAASSYKTLRYFFPLIFTWDILLPLFFLHATAHFKFPFLTSTRSHARAVNTARLLLSIILILSFIYLTYYNISPPGPAGTI